MPTTSGDRPDELSDHELLMWNVEKDPWLNPNGASITVVDKPIDPDRFRRYVRYAVTQMPRLYQRVAPPPNPLSKPVWVPDAEFDYDYHVKQVELAAPGTRRQLFDLAAELYSEPLDRSRPLWRFVLITGLEGGGGALYSLAHHVVADGIAQLQMAQYYQQLTPDERPPDEVDLDGFLAQRVAEHQATAGNGDDLAAVLGGIGRRFIDEVGSMVADPGRVVEKAEELGVAVQSATDLLSRGSKDGADGGSPLWKNRSGRRRLELVAVPLDGLIAAAKKLGGSVNDAFMVGLTEGAVRYHAERDTTVEAFNTSFVVSTRAADADGSAGDALEGNAFTPVPVQVSGRELSFEERMAEMQAATAEARAKSDRSGGISALSGAINLLPIQVITTVGRRQAANVDFATSNLRGVPFTMYCAGSTVEAMICMGPLAGTAANITALSYDGAFNIGLFIDPEAITDGEAYRRCVDEAFTDLVALGAPPKKKPAKKKAAPKKKPASKKKAAAKKKPAKKKPATKKKPASKKKPAAKKKPAKNAKE